MTMSGTVWSQSLSISTVEESYTHSFTRIVLIFFTILTALFAVAVNVLFFVGQPILGLQVFDLNASNLFATYTTNVTPSEWFYYLWTIVFVWQLIWLSYGASTIYRKSSSDYLYKYPPVMHWLVYFNFSVSNLIYAASLIMWSKRMFLLTTCYFLLVFVGLYIGIFTSVFKLFDYQREMYYTEKTKDVWAIRFLVQNGIYLYATWAFVMFVITLDQTLVYQFGLGVRTTHLIILLVLFVKLIVYFLVENMAAYKYCKFILTPWILYGLYVYETIFKQTIFERKLKYYENVIPIYRIDETGQISLLNAQFTYTKLNINFFMHVSLMAVFAILLAVKVFKFVWSEICYRKKISI